MSAAIGAMAGLVVGFIGGLCAYRTSRRWCPTCGGGLACVDPACPAGVPVPRRPGGNGAWNGPTVANPQVGRAGRLTRGQEHRTRGGQP